MKTYIGCSGYHYSDWKEKFYPKDLQKKEWLGYYAKHFDTVEINNTFYKMPEEKKLKKWKENTPENFKLTIKANRYFTHQKKLKADGAFKDRLETFVDLAEVLGEKLGCILWQLPGNLHKDVSKLKDLGKLLKNNSRNVLEFRHKSWFDDEVFEVLAEQDISYCMISAPGDLPEKARATTETAYLRFHGKNDWYNHYYSQKELQTWEKRIKKLKNVKHLFVYFNNDHNANATKNAQKLKFLLEN